jgi:Bacterial Ig-like domain (group 2)
MDSFRPKLGLSLAIASLLIGGGCTGFFVSPTLTSISITPNPVSVTPGQSQPLVATGANNDGSSSNLTGQATWTSSDTNATFVKLSPTGVVTGIQNTTTPVTVTATFKGISGTDSVTVGAQAVTITCGSCTNNTISISGDPAGTVTLSSNVAANWTSSDSSIISVSGTNTVSPTATLGGGSNIGTVTITATATSGGGSGTLQITVTN